jgi:SagB-type dehydrogenase family enzyme
VKRLVRGATTGRILPPATAALEYHRRTFVPRGGTDEVPCRLGNRPSPVTELGGAEQAPLDGSVAGRLLDDAAGITRTRSFPGLGTFHFRRYSSAGALYPLEAYVAAPGGLYAYDPVAPALARLAANDVRPALAAALARPEEAEAEAAVVVTGVLARTAWKYGERGFRHVWWDAGTMLANVLALAAARGLAPRLYTGFVDARLNELLAVDGRSEAALAVVALGERRGPRGEPVRGPAPAPKPTEQVASGAWPLAERLRAAATLPDDAAVRAWRGDGRDAEPVLPLPALRAAIARRTSVRRYAAGPIPRDELAELLRWAGGPLPADAPSVVRMRLAVAALDGLEPGIYDEELRLVAKRPEDELRAAMGSAGMDQEHPRLAAVNVVLTGNLETITRRLGDRGYCWAQLEAGIRAGRLQVGAALRGWGAAAATFYDDDLAAELETDDAPLLMVSLGLR